jgi:hypothetical protein
VARRLCAPRFENRKPVFGLVTRPRFSELIHKEPDPKGVCCRGADRRGLHTECREQNVTPNVRMADL